MSTDRGKAKQNAVHPHSGILFGHKKESSDVPRRGKTLTTLLSTRSQAQKAPFHDPIYMKCPGRAGLQPQKAD